jgi:hypothetical protein
MKRIIIATGAVLLASVPATLGLVGNTSFAQSVPVRVPQQASVLDDNDRPTPHVETGDDNGGQRSPSAVETGDDNGGQRSPSAVEPGDDNGGLVTQVEPATGKVSDSGTATDDNGGHGGDTSGSDTSGSGGKDDGSGHS